MEAKRSRRTRNDARIGVFTYKTSDPAHAHAIVSASKKLNMSIFDMVEAGVNALLAAAGHDPMPPRKGK